MPLLSSLPCHLGKAEIKVPVEGTVSWKGWLSLAVAGMESLVQKVNIFAWSRADHFVPLGKQLQVLLRKEPSLTSGGALPSSWGRGQTFTSCACPRSNLLSELLQLFKILFHFQYLFEGRLRGFGYRVPVGISSFGRHPAWQPQVLITKGFFKLQCCHCQRCFMAYWHSQRYWRCLSEINTIFCGWRSVVAM